MTDLMHARPSRTAEAPDRVGPEGAVVRPRSAEPVALNPTALALWELCDGATTVVEMVDAVSMLFALDPANARADIESALEDMFAAGVIR